MLRRCVSGASARLGSGRGVIAAAMRRGSGVSTAWEWRGTGVRGVITAWELRERSFSTAWGASAWEGRHRGVE